MAGWADIEDDLNADVIDQVPQSATWRSARDQSETTVDVVLYLDTELLNQETGQYEARDTLHVNAADLAQPYQGDRVTVAGVGRRVDRYQLDNGLWRVVLQREYGT